MVNNKYVIGIIAEFNPFHEGHSFLIHRIKCEFQIYLKIILYYY